MRILYVCHRFPYPPSRGGKIRPFNMISHLSQRHEVTVASLARSREEAEAGAGIAEHCHKFIVEVASPPAALARMIVNLVTATPSSMGYFYTPRLARRIREEIASRKFDLIFVHCSSVAPYVADVRGVTKILDYGDMDSQKWLIYGQVRQFPLSLGCWLEGVKLRRAERTLAAKFDFCTCTTRAEFDSMREIGIDRPGGWFPNGVDLEYFAPSEAPYEPDTICFIGRMDYYPNQRAMLEFCARTLPLIRARRPAVKLAIIGADPSSAINALGKIPAVTVTGTVPDVRSHVLRSAVNVAPLSIARGTQNKILESMAMGVPVVASPDAARGIDAVPGEHLIAAANPQTFADAVCGLLDDPDRRHRLAIAGRRRMETNHDWQASMKRLDALIEECLSNTGGDDPMAVDISAAGLG